MNFKLRVWRQPSDGGEGGFERHEVSDIDPEASFLEMLDILNERIVADGGDPIAYDRDCMEGICGSCSLLIDGIPHGPRRVTSCQTFMRDFPDGADITVEPFRNAAFPVIRDLVVDRIIVIDGGRIAAAALLAAGKHTPRRAPAGRYFAKHL